MHALSSSINHAAARAAWPAQNPIRVRSRGARLASKDHGARSGRSARLAVRADENWSDSTQAVHNGERGGRPRVSDSLTTPVCMTSTYWFKDTEELIAYQEGRYGSFEYGRYGNPTARACEEKIRLLEGGEDCLLSASGGASTQSLVNSTRPRARKKKQSFPPLLVHPLNRGALRFLASAPASSCFPHCATR